MTVCSEKGKLKKSENIDLLGTSKNVPAMQVGGVYHAKDFLDNNCFSQLYVTQLSRNLDFPNFSWIFFTSNHPEPNVSFSSPGAPGCSFLSI